MVGKKRLMIVWLICCLWIGVMSENTHVYAASGGSGGSVQRIGTMRSARPSSARVAELASKSSMVQLTELMSVQESEFPGGQPTEQPPAQMTEAPVTQPTGMPPVQVTETPPAASVPPESATPEQTLSPSALPLALKNSGAKLLKGGQKGIGYGKVKNEKVYHIRTYVTDEVQLKPTKKCSFKLTGGSSKKDVNAGKVKVTSDGRVICRDKAKDKKQYAIVQMTALGTGECIYAYVYFAPRIYAKTSPARVVYQGKTAALSCNYPWKNIRFTSSDPKVAGVNQKGTVTAKKQGTAVITAKVKDSDNNVFKAKITVKEEPWLVNDKDTLYTYEDMTADLREIAGKYRGKASLSSIGSSEDGRNIWCLRIGNASAGKKLVIDGAIHAREWLNSQMLLRKCEEILREYGDYKSRLSRVCVYVVPMINPDGVAISQSGFGAIRSEKLRKTCKKTKSSSRTWKGNARGVNLNFNFPGGWNPKGKAKKPDGVTYPGEKAASEKETKAMMRFINRLSGVKGVLNYHSMGSVLYWNYNVESNAALRERQTALAYKINSFTKYRLMPKSISTDPNGGLGDWLIYNKKIPTVTVETGSVPCPLPHSQFKKIMKENSGLLSWFVGEY